MSQLCQYPRRLCQRILAMTLYHHHLLDQPSHITTHFTHLVYLSTNSIKPCLLHCIHCCCSSSTLTHRSFPLHILLLHLSYSQTISRHLANHLLSLSGKKFHGLTFLLETVLHVPLTIFFLRPDFQSTGESVTVECLAKCHQTSLSFPATCCQYPTQQRVQLKYTQ